MISSQTSTAGSAASARAIATRWRSPPESSPGKRDGEARGQAHLLEQVGELALAPAARSRPRRIRAGPDDRLADAVARVERLERVLEDDLDRGGGPRASGRARARASGSPSSRIEPAAGRCRPAMQRADRRLARARLADERQARSAVRARRRGRRTARRLRSRPLRSVAASPSTASSRRRLAQRARAATSGSPSASGGVRSYSKQRTSAAPPAIEQRRQRGRAGRHGLVAARREGAALRATSPTPAAMPRHRRRAGAAARGRGSS